MTDSPTLLSLIAAPPDLVEGPLTVGEFFRTTRDTAGATPFLTGIARALRADRFVAADPDVIDRGRGDVGPSQGGGRDLDGEVDRVPSREHAVGRREGAPDGGGD